ncbi:Putative hydrolase Mb2248c [Talaromyces islandicus]|uniref:Putative hydrolase Mb2248c n=1 Tax=Talaromyces islandicus TaxID=28573 RepID=A0A0U1LU31_TALIS|nr:Putative hydrolase Mb2248c [Talaromyces islandicus]
MPQGPVGEFDVSGKIVAITGGASGIGLELAKLVLAKSAKVLIADLRLTPEAESLVDGKTAIYVKTDVANWSELENIVTVSKNVLGDVPDVYVAGAAVFEPEWSNFWDDTETESYRSVQINVNHPLKLTRIALRALLSRNKKGVVLIVASMGGYQGNIAATMYCTTKHALVGFTRSIGQLDSHEGVKVVTICPGMVDTPLWDTKPTAKKQLGYDPKLVMSARTAAEAELDLIESGKYKGGTVYEFSTLGGREIPTYFITPPGSTAPGLECGRLNVPIDWNDPRGEQTSLGLVRLKASNSSARIGPLLFNSGGPGSIPSEFINYTAQGLPLFGNILPQHFDLIGLDPRGMGMSDPVRCDPALANRRVSFFPTTQAEWDEMVAYNEEFAASCYNLTGALFAHVDTTSVARDMEAVRIGLGGEKLNWLGLSYATQIGVAYAELYPQDIRAMVLDGNLEHSLDEVSNMVTESTAYETELVRFADWCAGNSSCALHGKDVLAVFDEVASKADAAPIPAPGCDVTGACRSNVTGEEIRFNTQSFLLFKEPQTQLGIPGWGLLGDALNQTLHGNATILSTALETSDIDSETFAGLAVSCLDWTHSTRSLEDILYKEQLAKTLSPHTQGASQTWGIQSKCIGWPVPVANPPHKTHIRGAPAMLLVNSLYDPSTSIVWANSRFAQMPSSASMAIRKGDGHTSYTLGGESTAAMVRFLVELEKPAPNTVYTS